MAYTYDLGTSVGQVRLIIPDSNEAAAFFSDEEIGAFLGLERGNVRRAAAFALDTMASNEAMVSKRIKILDLSTDGPAVAKELRERAMTLRGQAETEEEQSGALFDVAEMVYDDFTLREYLEKEALRNG